jgi:tetratricopeptide (TPR) repeat protein
MVKYLIILLLFIALRTSAQQPINFATADSITYSCYLSGDWDKLIKTGENALTNNINFKRLQQRLGYAYFVRHDYFAAQTHYEQALIFDQSDSDTQTYLYYCGLNINDQGNANFAAEKMPLELQKKLNISLSKVIDVIDLEYNYKSNSTLTRSNPTYMRFGINSQLNLKTSLYQALSSYQQTIDGTAIKQPEYFLFLKRSISAHTSLNIGYHYINTKNGTTISNGNLAYFGLNSSINRYKFDIHSSVLNDGGTNISQFGIKGGVTLPGEGEITLTSCLDGVSSSGYNSLVFGQSINARWSKRIWTEGYVTLGNLKNYNDNNGLYVYNLVDPITFRTGAILYVNLTNKFTLFGNCGYESKQIEKINKNLNTNYSQQSFSIGTIWKL